MIYGDAFNDMPKEYREYREQNIDIDYGPWKSKREQSVGIWARRGTVEIKGDTVSMAGLVLDREQREADKAIADGKPRWMHHDIFGWQYVVIKSSEHRNAQPVLVYILASPGNGEFDLALMLVKAGVEILPYGETPPPAAPEKLPYTPDPLPGNIAFDIEFTQFKFNEYQDLLWLKGGRAKIEPSGQSDNSFIIFVTGASPVEVNGWDFVESADVGCEGVVFVRKLRGDHIAEDYGGYGRVSASGNGDYWFLVTPDGIPTLNRCPDCDNTLEERSMPDGIEEWCAECNMKV